MTKTLIAFIFGLLLGSSAVFFLNLNPKEPVCDRSKAISSIGGEQQCREELAKVSAELESLKQSKPRSDMEGNPSVAEDPKVDDGTPESDKSAESARAISWRISAIEKFVPVSDEQRTQLEDKFKEEREAAEEERASESKSLDEILGAENAKTYRDQVQSAFNRARDEELEKDALWISKTLGLSGEQEQRMQTIYSEVEREIRGEGSESEHLSGGTPQQRLARMIAENRKRLELRSSKLKSVLSSEQYQAYLQAESGSSSGDLEVFHDSGER
jgi:hypothetical protein